MTQEISEQKIVIKYLKELLSGFVGITEIDKVIFDYLQEELDSAQFILQILEERQ